MAITDDATPNGADASQLLHVDVHELAGARPFVARDRDGALQGAEFVQPQHLQRATDRRRAHADNVGISVPPTPAPQALDFHDRGGRDRARRGVRTTRPILERERGVLRPLAPFFHRPITHAEGPSDDGDRDSAGHAADDFGSTVSGRARILVTVHSGPLSVRDGRLATTTFAEGFRMDNLLKAHN
jgi:hypothetical protein